MAVIDDNRVSGSLRDLEVFGVGEDEDVVLACYEGKVKDVCALVEV